MSELSTKEKLPTIAELYADKSLQPLQKAGLFQALVNQNPHPSWIKKHPTIKKEILDEHGQKKSVPLEYIPIERIEWLITAIFLKYRVEAKTIQLIGNSIVISVRLHYFNHIDNEWDWQDGIGASPLQTDKGAGAIEFDKLKSSAVQMAAPAAESYAVKDAAEKIGKLFGKDLNRRDIISYDSLGDRYSTLKSNKEKLNGKKD
ncbi:MAG TPA: hypothetical protein VL728_19605 [Cyclobacteriaceae bacterium]|jgi:hypothetical protein|nr:hypothetical protein [Cyclobacteriaceae bacterium]